MESLLQEDIIVKCSLEEMVKAFFKDYAIVWHDPSLNSQENQQYMALMEKFCEVITFTEWKKVRDYINNTQATCHVITSGTNGEFLVKEICGKENVCNVYVFCRNKEYHSSWARNYQKVSSVEIEIGDVLDQIQKKLMEWYKRSSSFKLTLPAFAPIFNDGDKSQMNHLHRFLKVIPNFHNREQAKNDFTALSRGIYSDKKNTGHIESFEKTYTEYNKEAILKWYTQQSFLYKVINNSLRIATSDSIQYSRLLLKDLERAIQEQYQTKSKNFSGLLYRGCYLSDKEWSSLKDNLHREIEMHGFMSVSKEKSVALDFMGFDHSKKVFITIIVPKGPNEEEQGFAEIEEFSKFPNEKEILFNVRSRFTVLEAEEKYSTDLPSRHLVLLYGAQGFRKLIAEKNPIEEVSILKMDDILCGCCNIQVGKMSQKTAFLTLKEKVYYCQKCVNTQDIQGPLLLVSLIKTPKKLFVEGCVLTNPTLISFYGYECCKCRAKKLKRYYRCLDCNYKETYCENCLKNCVQSEHRIVLETNPYTFWCQKMTQSESSHLKFQQQLMKKSEVFQQPEMYFESHEYEKAMRYYMAYLERYESKGKKDGDVATAYDHIGLIYKKRGDYKKALEHHIKALEMYKSAYGENHYDIAAAYHNMGSVYHHQAEYKNAIDCYFKCLEIYEAIYEKGHPRVATVYGNIANVYESQGEREKAFEYHYKALEIREVVYGENHPHVATSYNDIGNLYDSQGDHMKALECHLKSLEIDRAVYGENHPNIAASYNNIGSLYDQQKNYEEALEYHSKALHIYKSVYEENHPNIATCYNNIGMVNMNQGKYTDAEEYLLKALKIREFVYGENHPHVATCYNNLGLIYYNQGEYDKALENHTKALDIRISVYGDQHPHVATCYLNIGNVYEKQQNSKKAYEFHSTALGITETVFGGGNPLVMVAKYYLQELAQKLGFGVGIALALVPGGKLIIEGAALIGGLFGAKKSDPLQDKPIYSHHVQDLIGKTAVVKGGHGLHSNLVIAAVQIGSLPLFEKIMKK